MGKILIVFSTIVIGTPASAAPQQKIFCKSSIVAALAQAAIKHARLNSRPGRWRRRIAWRALLPRLSAGLSRTTGAGDHQDINAAQQISVDLNYRVALRWEIRATWDLTKVIFDADELRAAKLQHVLAERRRRLGAQVVALYFRWANGRASGSSDKGKRRQRLEILLNLATDGAFSRLRKHCRR